MFQNCYKIRLSPVSVFCKTYMKIMLLLIHLKLQVKCQTTIEVKMANLVTANISQCSELAYFILL